LKLKKKRVFETERSRLPKSPRREGRPKPRAGKGKVSLMKKKNQLNHEDKTKEGTQQRVIFLKTPDVSPRKKENKSKPRGRKTLSPSWRGKKIERK